MAPTRKSPKAKPSGFGSRPGAMRKSDPRASPFGRSSLPPLSPSIVKKSPKGKPAFPAKLTSPSKASSPSRPRRGASPRNSPFSPTALSGSSSSRSTRSTNEPSTPILKSRARASSSTPSRASTSRASSSASKPSTSTATTTSTGPPSSTPTSISRSGVRKRKTPSTPAPPPIPKRTLPPAVALISHYAPEADMPGAMIAEEKGAKTPSRASKRPRTGSSSTTASVESQAHVLIEPALDSKTDSWESRGDRMEAAMNTWGLMASAAATVVSETTRPVASSIASWLKSAAPVSEGKPGTRPVFVSARVPLPVAAVSSSIASGDGAALWSVLEEEVKSTATPHITILRPSDLSTSVSGASLTHALAKAAKALSKNQKMDVSSSSSFSTAAVTAALSAASSSSGNVKTSGRGAIAAVVRGLLATAPTVMSRTGEPLRLAPRVSLDMDVLSAWHEALAVEAAAHGAYLPPTLVVVAAEAQAWPSAPLTALTSALAAARASGLPISLVLGASGRVGSVLRNLPATLAGSMLVKAFAAPRSGAMLTAAVESLVINPPDGAPRLSSAALDVAMDGFLNHSGSVREFSAHVHESLLAAAHNGFWGRPIPESWSKEDAEAARRLPSVRADIEHGEIGAAGADIQAAHLSDDLVLARSAEGWLEDLEALCSRISSLIRFLPILSEALPQNLHFAVDPVYESYSELLRGGGAACTSVKSLVAAVGGMRSEEDLVRFMACFEAYDHEWCSKRAIKNMKEAAKNGISAVGKASAAPSQVGEEDSIVPASSSSSVTTPNSRSRGSAALQAVSGTTIRSPSSNGRGKDARSPTAASSSASSSAVSQGVVAKALALAVALQEAVNKSIPAPNTLPMHEWVFVGSGSALEASQHPCPRSDIHTILSNPSEVLGDAAHQAPDESWPDIALAYHLYSQMGRLINMQDWLDGFRIIIGADESEGDPKEDQLVQARFVWAVAQLAHLGMIKSTRQKADHVARLFWSD